MVDRSGDSESIPSNTEETVEIIDKNNQSIIERITTGSDQLDEVLCGGIPRYSTVFVAGFPGAGKTILCEQILFANARLGRTCLYLSTLSEPPIKLLRFLQGFKFFQPELFGSKVVYGDLGSALQSEGLEGLLKQLDELVKKHRPDLVVIDSFKVLRDLIPDHLQFREFTSNLAIRLSIWGITSLLVGEYSARDIGEGPEFAIGDGIIYLYGTEEAERQNRYLRVMKMRGTASRSGEHYFEIGSNGIELYPRLPSGVVGEYETPVNQRLGSAIEGLSEMLEGGVFSSSVTLISGATGTGKSLTALSFLVEAARRGQPGLLVSFEESPNQLARNCLAFGWDLKELMRKGLLDILHVSPSELNIDHHSYIIQERARAIGAKIVAIDGITAFEAAISNAAIYQSYFWAICDYFKRNGISVILTSESRNLFEPLDHSSRGISFISDNIIFLRYVEVGSELKRVVGVMKMRGSGHDRKMRELIIDLPRMYIGSELDQIGILGTTMRQSK